MKISMIMYVTALVLACNSCASQEVIAANCPSADVKYAGSALNENNNRIALFSIKNSGNFSVELPLENKSSGVVHGRYASTEQRSSNNMAWQVFNPILEEMLAPKSNLTIAPGQEKQFKFDLNGLLLNDQQEAGMEYSVVLKDVSGCTFRSAPFNP